MRMQPIESIDHAALYFFSTHQVWWLNPVMVFITSLGDTLFLARLGGEMAVLLLFWRGWRTAVIFGVAVVLAWWLCRETKEFVARPRPDVAYELVPRPTSPSFPSGHALDSVAVYGLFGLLVTNGMPSGWRRIGIRFVCFFFPFVIGFSRLYVAVHFVSDVLAGWLGGLAVILIAWGLDRPTPSPELAK
jgi:undecaprenyl-diphosphatase